MSEPRCARCGEPIDGLGIINAKRYCHPDDETKPDCYTLECWAMSDKKRSRKRTWAF